MVAGCLCSVCQNLYDAVRFLALPPINIRMSSRANQRKGSTLLLNREFGVQMKIASDVDGQCFSDGNPLPHSLLAALSVAS